MRQHENLQQGTPDWHEFRRTHFGASEAAAMLGLSKHMSRSELLEFKATGKTKEYSDWTQKNILDYGHEVEHSARLITESLIYAELFPVTCSMDKLSASCDGLTFDGEIAWEHKQWNNDLAGHLFENGTVPDSHMPQCQQILMVTKAEKLIFVVSDGTKENMASVEVKPDQSWFMRITQGWAQFQHDLKNYQPKEIPEKPEPEPIIQLPALSIQIKGEVTVSNLPQFKEAAESFIANIKTDLKTDDDFSNAEATVKFCDDTEKKLESAKAAAIGQTASIDELMRTIDFIKESIRSKRLALEKLVKTQKEKIKDEIIKYAYSSCALHVQNIHEEFRQIQFAQLSASIFTRQNFETACKNKRTLASLHNAVDTEVAAIKIKLDDLARIVRKNLTHLPEDLSLFRDLQSIITKSEDDFKLLVESRLTEQKRKDEEAAQRAISEAKEAETRGKAHMAAAQERERMAKENEERCIQAAKEVEAKQDIQDRPSVETNQEHREKIINEAMNSMNENGIDESTATKILSLIMRKKIKHVTINFERN